MRLEVAKVWREGRMDDDHWRIQSFFSRKWKCSGIVQCWWLHKAVNILKTTEWSQGASLARTLRSHCRGLRLSPWWQTKISHAAWCNNIKKIKINGIKKENHCFVWTYFAWIWNLIVCETCLNKAPSRKQRNQERKEVPFNKHIYEGIPLPGNMPRSWTVLILGAVFSVLRGNRQSWRIYQWCGRGWGKSPSRPPAHPQPESRMGTLNPPRACQWQPAAPAT